MTHISSLDPQIQELFQHACAVQKKAYAPYSKYLIGTALRSRSGRIHTGCNVENSSFGGTICAERTATFKMVSEEGRGEITVAVIVSDASPPWPPCGLCRQVFSEFAAKDMQVIAANLRGEARVFSFFKDLMPEAFTPAHCYHHPQT